MACATLEEANAKKKCGQSRWGRQHRQGRCASGKDAGDASSTPPTVADDAAVDVEEFDAEMGGSGRGQRTAEQMDLLRVQMLTKGYPLAELSEKENERAWESLIEKRRQTQLLNLVGLHYDEMLKRVRQQRQELRRS